MKQRTNQKREPRYVKWILIVTLVLVVAIVGYTVVDSVGLIAQFSTAGKSENFKLNENITDVYRYLVGQQEFTYYWQYLSMYLNIYASTSPDSAYDIVNGMDPMGGTFMEYAVAGRSGLDYVYDHIEHYITEGRFDASAYSTTRQVLAYCEGARDAGLYDDYKKAVKSDVDASIADMKATAKSLGVTFHTFRSRYMGNGVSEKEVRRALEMQLIAAEYAEKLNLDFMNAVTTTEAEEYRESHKESFYSASYYAIKLTNEDVYKAVKDGETLDAIAEALAKYYFEKNYEEAITKHFSKITDYNKEQTKADILTTVLAMNGIGDYKEVFTAEDVKANQDTYKVAARNAATTINTTTATNKTSLKAEVEKITKYADGTATDTAYVDITGSSATDLQKWLFNAARKADDFTILKETSTSSTTTTATTTYTLYIMKTPSKWDTDKNLEKTKDLFYVKLTDDATTGDDAPEDPKTAAEKAELMYAELAKLIDDKGNFDKDAFAEKFAELVEKYQSGSTSTIQENVSESSLSDANLKAWAYNPLRKSGDLAILPLSEADKKVEDEAAKVEGGSESESESESESTTTNVYIVFFVEENLPTWEETCRTAIADEELNDWFDKALDDYNVKVNYKFETTAETEAA